MLSPEILLDPLTSSSTLLLQTPRSAVPRDFKAIQPVWVIWLYEIEHINIQSPYTRTHFSPFFIPIHFNEAVYIKYISDNNLKFVELNHSRDFMRRITDKSINSAPTTLQASRALSFITAHWKITCLFQTRTKINFHTVSINLNTTKNKLLD